ncbi:MAG: hypothetical protein JWL61_2310 [Gemmatimonadetes bacterium]|nr:hypothetical protein [Gemmatimonadota bacterium]
MSIGGTDRAARRMLREAQRLRVTTMADDDEVMRPSAVAFAALCGLEPDSWQVQVLTSQAPKQAFNCCRQSGKSTTAAVQALHEALYCPQSLALLLSPSLRQSSELFRKVIKLYQGLDDPPVGIVNESTLRVEFTNGSRVIALPGSESTTRGYSAATIVIIDEAARVQDELIAAVRPSLATTNGRLIALSTPAGRRGWFYETWQAGEGWERTRVEAKDCPRISATFLEDERRELGEFVFASEYCCEFQDISSSVFASDLIERALSDATVPGWRALGMAG